MNAVDAGSQSHFAGEARPARGPGSTRRRRAALALAALALAALAIAARADAYVYWTSYKAGTIGRANLNGSGGGNFIGGADSPVGVAVDGAIYWANGGPNAGTIGRANLNGRGVNQGFISAHRVVNGVAVDGAHVYWTTGTTIGRANLDGSGVDRNFIAGITNPTGMAVDAAHVYWADPFEGAIGRANLDGSGVDQSFITGAGSPYGVAVDGAHLYWANGFGHGTIGRAKLNGGGVDQSFIRDTSPAGVAVDGAHVYWTNTDTDAIGRANLDGSGVDQSFITGAGSPYGVAVDARGAPGAGQVIKHNSKITIADFPALHGRVKSSLRACERRRVVKLFFQRPHRHDKLVGRDRTNRRGRWKVEPMLYGTYYAKVTRRELRAGGKTHVCRGARSRKFSYGPGS
jgi:virginiamycin B lyase